MRSSRALPPSVGVLPRGAESYEADIVIVGSGMGGGTLAYALRESGAKVLLVERGDFISSEWKNADVTEVARNRCYAEPEHWFVPDGRAFPTASHYCVGGNTKFYGACLPRFRAEDFNELEHRDGTSPAWPFDYAELEPFYAEAERLYRVHASAGDDITEPARSGDYPFPELPHDAYVQDLAERLREAGTHPFVAPMGVDYRPGGLCILCDRCDGFPCLVQAKSDAESCAVRPALEGGLVSLLTGAKVIRLITNPSGSRITAAEAEVGGRRVGIRGGTFVLSAGAVNSAAILLRSATSMHPNGLGNGSGLLGRNYMAHNNSLVVAIDPRRRNRSVFQKTLALNDYYFGGDADGYPMGNLQLRGKLESNMFRDAFPRARGPLAAAAGRSVDWWVMSEDLPNPENRVGLRSDGSVQITWTPNNTAAHDALVRQVRRLMAQCGYPVTLHRRYGVETTNHQCGTAVCGLDPASSVLDAGCRSHEIGNLFVVDASFFPSSAAMNPSLTIAAQALRVAPGVLAG